MSARTRKKVSPQTIWIAAIVIIVAAAGIVVSIVLPNGAESPNLVPDLIGKPRSVAQRTVHDRGMTPHFIGKPDAPTCVQGADPKVVQQFPQAGQQKPKDRLMTIIIDCNG